MYLEKHRGTYTSQSNCKNFNREFEGKMLSFETLLSCLGEAGDKEKIEQEAKELIEKWGTPQGGFIGVEYGYLDAIGTTKESMLFELECFEKYGTYK